MLFYCDTWCQSIIIIICWKPGAWNAGQGGATPADPVYLVMDGLVLCLARRLE